MVCIYDPLTAIKLLLKIGSLPISTESVAFDHERFGSTISWNKNTLLIKNKPVIILSGEFHYWRLPDRSRWETILQQYKDCGLNCIRIYFHWGFHSPREGIAIP